MKEALDLLRGYAPEVVQCKGCGHPRLMGYQCRTCDDRDVRLIKARQEVLEELAARYPELSPVDLLKDIGIEISPVTVSKVTVGRRRRRARDMKLYKERMQALKAEL